MAESSESEMKNSIIWSKTQYNLADFIKEFPLPQVVRVVDGHYSENEETSFGADQVLALHEIFSTTRVIGTDYFDKPVAIPLECSTKVEVCPSKLKHMNYNVQDLKSIFPKVVYVKVDSSETETEEENSIEVGDLLQITKIDKKGKFVLFQNVETRQSVSLNYACSVVLTPLLDYKRYTISEIKANYGFPIKVRFPKDARRRSAKSRGSSKALSSLGEIVLCKEATETLVVSTTVGDGVGDKRCIGLPKDLPVNFAVAEGFTKGGGSYEEVVRTLHTGFKVTNLADFDQLNICQHLNAVRTFDYTIADNLAAVSRPLPEPDRQVPTLPRKGTESSPALPVRSSSKSEVHGSARVSAKLSRKHSRSNRKSFSQEMISTKSTKQGQNTVSKETLQKSTTSRLLPSQDRSNTTDPRSKNLAESENYKDQQSTEEQYTYVKMEGPMESSIYESDDGEYQDVAYYRTELGSEETRAQTEYEIPEGPCPPAEDLQVPPNFDARKRISEISIASQENEVSTPTNWQISGNFSDEWRDLLFDEKEDIYKRIAFIPKDLSELTVNDIGEVLMCLHMQSYVATFEDEQIDGAILKDLDLPSLESLNVSKFHGKKLIKFVGGWRPQKGQRK